MANFMNCYGLGDIQKFLEVNISNHKNEYTRCVACVSRQIWSRELKLFIINCITPPNLQIIEDILLINFFHTLIVSRYIINLFYFDLVYLYT